MLNVNKTSNEVTKRAKLNVSPVEIIRLTQWYVGYCETSGKAPLPLNFQIALKSLLDYVGA